MLGLLLALDAGCRRTDPADGLPARPEAAALPPGLAAALDAAEAALAAGPSPEEWHHLGRLYHANGYYREAWQAYRASGRADARTAYLQADLARQLGEPGQEIAQLEAALRAEPGYVPTWFWLAEARYKSGDLAGARLAYAEVLQRDPDHPHARLGVAREHLRAGARDEAARELAELVSRHPAFSSALALQARLAEQAGEVRRAVELRERSRGRKDPPVLDPWLDDLLPQCYDLQRLGIGFEDHLKAGLAEQAKAYLARMEAVAPGHWQVHRFHAIVAAQQGLGPQAVQAYAAALAAEGDPDALYPGLVDELVRQERTDEAERRAREGLRAAPRNVPLHTDLAELHWRRGDAAGAERWLRQALALAPQDVPALRLLSWILWQGGRRAEARPHLETLQRLVPGEIAARAMLGEWLLEEGRPEAALTPLQEAVASEPANAEVRERLAVAWLRVGNQRAREGHLEQALAAYDAAVTARPAHLEAYTNKARVLLAAGRPADALAAYGPLAEADAANPQVYLNFGDIARAAGRPDVARQHWQAARARLGPGSDAALREAIDQRLDSAARP